MFFVLRYVPDRYKAQEICNKAILENGGKFESIPDQHKIQDMYDKTVDNNAQDWFSRLRLRLTMPKIKSLTDIRPKAYVIKPSVFILLQ